MAASTPELVKLADLPVGTHYRRPKGRVPHILLDPKDVYVVLVKMKGWGFYVDSQGRLKSLSPRPQNDIIPLDDGAIRWYRNQYRQGHLRRDPSKALWALPLSTRKLTTDKPQREVVVLSRPTPIKTLWELLESQDLDLGAYA